MLKDYEATKVNVKVSELVKEAEEDSTVQKKPSYSTKSFLNGKDLNREVQKMRNLEYRRPFWGRTSTRRFGVPAACYVAKQQQVLGDPLS